MDAPAIPCLRCGTFAGASPFPVPGIAFCADCLEDRHPGGKDPILHHPPPWITWRWIRPFTAVGVLLAIAAGLATGRGAVLTQGLASGSAIGLGIAVVTGVVLGLIFEAIGLGFFDYPGNGGLRAWKAHLVAQLGLGSGEGWTFVLWARHHPSALEHRLPVEYGLLAASRDGLVFLGARGTRFALPRAQVRGHGLEWLRIFLPPRRGLRLELEGRPSAYVVVLDRPTFAECLEAEVALGDLLTR